MTAVADTARVLGQAGRLAVAELGVLYSWRSWLFGWVLRVVMQIVFFALIGILLDDPALVEFLLIGNVALMAATNVMFAIPSTQAERYAGTLSLLVASPSRVMWVFLGRSVEWCADAVVTSTVGLLVAAPLFGVRVPLTALPWVVALLLLIAVASYGLATLLGAFVLHNFNLRNVTSNTVVAVMAVVTGANVPVSFFPEPVEWFAQLFPLTHGLEAVRSVIAGAPAGVVLPDVGWCALAGVLWMVAAALSFERFAARGRRDGSIEFDL